MTTLFFEEEVNLNEEKIITLKPHAVILNALEKAAKTKWYQNPFTWIIGIAVLAVIGLLVYHNKKK